MTFQREPVRAPALAGSAWLNVAEPLTWEKLRGKLVLLDFWTYCCINCLHVLAEVRALEEKYADQPFVVIGVHSAKFTNEQEITHIREAVGRYGIRHPVVVDAGNRLWDAFGVRGWPTLVLVDPQGYLVATVAGEGHGAQLDAAIGQALRVLRERDALDDAPLPLRQEFDAMPMTALRYPGKIVADAQNDRLYIADSGYHRIVVTTLAGAHVATIGAGQPGNVDGPADSAAFNHPQGLALETAQNALYVADTNNHLIRRIDLTAMAVTTVAGTGAQNRLRFPAGPARAVALNSPWDLAWRAGTLWIAMAGQHQIWALDCVDGTIRAAVGSSGEGRRDGDARAAAFAQPSGLALSGDGRDLYVADSEISCIRAIDLAAPEPTVMTVAGGDLFDFGLRDGVGDAARFQHPLGIAWHGDHLFIADTYNHAIRRLDPQTRRVQTVAGDGIAGDTDGAGRAARFYEPGGITAAGDLLYIADTNNHAIRVVEAATGRVTTLALSGVCAPGICLP
jgi:DNA-binding beta-propeller fold protein YncE